MATHKYGTRSAKTQSIQLDHQAAQVSNSDQVPKQKPTGEQMFKQSLMEKTMLVNQKTKDVTGDLAAELMAIMPREDQLAGLANDAPNLCPSAVRAASRQRAANVRLNPNSPRTPVPTIILKTPLRTLNATPAGQSSNRHVSDDRDDEHERVLQAMQQALNIQAAPAAHVNQETQTNQATQLSATVITKSRLREHDKASQASSRISSVSQQRTADWVGTSNHASGSGSAEDYDGHSSYSLTSNSDTQMRRTASLFDKENKTTQVSFRTRTSTPKSTTTYTDTQAGSAVRGRRGTRGRQSHSNAGRSQDSATTKSTTRITRESQDGRKELDYVGAGNDPDDPDDDKKPKKDKKKNDKKINSDEDTEDKKKQREYSSSKKSYKNDFKAKLRTYNGDPYVEQFLEQFRITATVNGWPEEEWGCHLVTALEGKARVILTTEPLPPKPSWKLIAKRLRSHFGSDASECVPGPRITVKFAGTL
jgi:hypothetical protein